MAKRDKFQGRVEDGITRPCNWPDCENAGAFRAPRAPDADGKKPAWKPESALDDRNDDSSWFCLEHVREYNSEWDYFDGMSEEQINAFRDEDPTWHRPTWPAGSPGQERYQGQGQGEGNGKRKEFGRDQPWTGTGDFGDPHGLFSGARSGAAAAEGFNRPLDLRDLKALNVLGLDEGATAADIKSSFKRLAKEHHPDLNNGDSGSEKRLRTVIEAYNRLSGAFADC